MQNNGMPNHLSARFDAGVGVGVFFSYSATLNPFAGLIRFEKNKIKRGVLSAHLMFFFLQQYFNCLYGNKAAPGIAA